MINKKDLNIRDPYILPYNGGYVICGTKLENGFNAYFSKDLEFFEGPYELFIGDDKEFERNNYWAPEIHKYRDKFYMFATLLPKIGKRFSQIFVSDSPLGTFEPLLRITPPEWGCLDATFFLEDEIPYAIFCHEWLQVEDGEICAIQLSSDLSKTIGAPILLFKASDAPWVKDTQFCESGENYCGKVTDGPFIFTDNNKLKMLWSSFSENNQYMQSIIESETGKLLGPWTQENVPFYSNNGGHGMVFEKDGQKIIALHSPNNSPLERLQLIKMP